MPSNNSTKRQSRQTRRRKRGSNNSSTSTCTAKTNTSAAIQSNDSDLLRVKLNESLIWNILHCDEIANCYSSANYEVEGVVEAIIDSLFNEEEMLNNYNFIKDFLTESLVDYLPDLLSEEQSTLIVGKVIPYLTGQVEDYKELHHSSDSATDDENDNNNDLSEDYDDVEEDSSVDGYGSDDDENYIQDGECELCERDVKLTRHHLIPRSTWPRMKPRFLEAAPYFKAGDMQMVEEILNCDIPVTLNAHHLSSGTNVKLFLSCYTCNICSLCHRTVHRTFDNLELAESRNSVERLLEDDTIHKFCKWANKQKPRRR